ncbi:MAG TPA: hypothetical protein VF989_06515 [Polyangiaceae bacterium]|jgi:hypothetical protein
MGSGWKIGVGLALGAAGVAACGGSAVLTECVGEYTGTFSGSSSGTLSGRVNDDRSFAVSFQPEGSASSMSGEGEIGDDGSIDLGVGVNRVTGQLDFSRCTARGNWSIGSAAGGNWQARRR